MAQRLLHVPSILILHLCTFSTEFIDMFYMTLNTNRNYFPQHTNHLVSVMQMVFSVRQEIKVYLDKLKASEAKGISFVCVSVNL